MPLRFHLFFRWSSRSNPREPRRAKLPCPPTNYHVVRGAQSIRIKLSSGDLYDAATILATDERRDIAVLQVAGFGLPALRLGNSTRCAWASRSS
jgi:hypothetical protein